LFSYYNDSLLVTVRTILFKYYNRNLAIPAIVVDGKIQFKYGGELPPLKDGSVVDICTAPSSIDDPNVIKLLLEEVVDIIFCTGTTLYVEVTVEDKELPEAGDKLEWGWPALNVRNKIYVPIELKQDLRMSQKGFKKGELLPCRCHIPEIPDEDARSINQAYYLISRKFESYRKSHAGNVFEKVFFEFSSDLKPLEHARKEFMSKNEERLVGLLRKV